jgi:hypothetical protein
MEDLKGVGANTHTWHSVAEAEVRRASAGGAPKEAE